MLVPVYRQSGVLGALYDAGKRRTLQEDERVSIAVRAFREDYATRTRGGRNWASDKLRDEGVVLKKANGTHLVDFEDGDEMKWWLHRRLT
ncbi:MAG: hypothetical protein SGPRY_006179 [Prymnesium sp.]